MASHEVRPARRVFTRSQLMPPDNHGRHARVPGSWLGARQSIRPQRAPRPAHRRHDLASHLVHALHIILLSHPLRGPDSRKLATVYPNGAVADCPPLAFSLPDNPLRLLLNLLRTAPRVASPV